MNTFGEIYRLTCFGESHGPAVGGVVDGVPAGIEVSVDAIQEQLDRRRPGQSSLTTARRESDRVEILSGIYEGRTLGTPIGFIIRNTDQRPADYGNLAEVYRPNHADYTYQAKYGVRDFRGGGRASARVTAAWVVGGAIAAQALSSLGIYISAGVISVGKVCGSKEEMEAEVLRAKNSCDSVGGVVECVVSGIKAGVGEPLFGKLHARLGAAMLSINAAKGFEYGAGFSSAGMRGSEMADEFYTDDDGTIHTRTNHSGGIQGGIANGEDIIFRVAFKPTPTIALPLETVDVNGNKITIEASGRHDPCVAFRAVPIVEAMAAMVVLDAVLQNRSARW